MKSSLYIGLLVPRFFRFYAHEVVTGMIEYAAQHRHIQFKDLRYRHLGEVAGCLDNVEVDAIVIGMDAADFGEVGRYLPRHIPIVNVHPDLLDPSIPTVCIDHTSLTTRLLNYLTGLGYRHIAAFGKLGSNAYDDLVDQLRQSCLKNRLSFDAHHVAIDPAIYDASGMAPVEAVDEWVRNLPKPTGVITSGGYSARFLSQTAERLGLDISGDVAIISRSDDEACLFATPPVSAIQSVGPRIGHAAVRILEATVGGNSHPTGRLTIPAPGIIERLSTGFPAGMDEDVRLAIHFVRQHACDGIGVPDILKRVPSISRSRLYEEYPKHVGRSPAADITRVRIDAAVHFLAHTELSITQVGDRCGFTSTSQFSDVFRREMGQSPSQWRKIQLS